jgi:hypothetical protein
MVGRHSRRYCRRSTGATGAKPNPQETHNERTDQSCPRPRTFDNYEKGGWDILVECWDDEEIAEVIGGAKTRAKAAIAACKRVVGTIDEYRSDVIATADW